MTLFHFGNCVALAYCPYFITYKCSGLSEYSAFWRCVQAGATYLLVQLGKMLFLATFFPTWEGAAGGYDLVGEFLKATVDLADVAGLQVALGRPAGKGELKILVAAVGWASAELVTARFVPLWVGARGIEFDWRYLQMGLDSNVSLLHHVALAALVWLSTRHDLPPRLRPPLGLLLLLGGYRGFLAQWAGQALGLGQWAALGVRAGLAAALGLGALRLLVTLLPAPER